MHNAIWEASRTRGGRHKGVGERRLAVARCGGALRSWFSGPVSQHRGRCNVRLMWAVGPGYVEVKLGVAGVAAENRPFDLSMALCALGVHAPTRRMFSLAHDIILSHGVV